MKPKHVILSAAAQAALDAIGAYAPVMPRNVRLPPPTGPAGPDHPPDTVAYDLSARRNIQGNIIPGFNKDHQHFLFYRIAALLPVKAFLRGIAPSITSMEEVLTFVQAHRAMRLQSGVREPRGLEATWVNIAFSCRGIEKLGAGTGEQFGEQSFRQGLAERSTYLGDPTDRSHPGHRSRWRVGGPHNEADILVIVASDTKAGLEEEVKEIRSSAQSSGLELIFEQCGETLPGHLRGHEHFGFKDGVSQPAIRGRMAESRDFITPRYLIARKDDPGDQLPVIYARPGQPLVWPGQFLLGEPRQSPEIPGAVATVATDFPSWAARGSYLVCRRLNQDVAAFWNFVAEAASRVGVPTIKLAATLVGRWPSGAPMLRTPASDDAALAGDPFANNHFIYDDDSRPASLREIPGYAGDHFAQAKADMLGAVCPHFAHVRKTNPRDSATDLGKFDDTLMRLILRRGIPFGAPVVGVKRPSTELLAQERGLMFLCYGATIEDQFEFITRRWINSSMHPNFGGHDPIIGQRDQRGDRTRFIALPTATGTVQLTLDAEWVTPTGGGYFFAPPIAALTGVLGV
jgi:Dyp-type peroxidase family